MIKLAALKEENPPPELLQFSKYVTQTQIPDWIKYDHALQIYERLKAAAHPAWPSCTWKARTPAAARSTAKSPRRSSTRRSWNILGRAITRINRYVQADCLAMRRERHDPLR